MKFQKTEMVIYLEFYILPNYINQVFDQSKIIFRPVKSPKF